MKAKVTCEAVAGKDLKPGDLFSTAGPQYWDRFDEAMGVGERVYIRTNNPPHAADDCEKVVYRLTITTDEEPS